MKNSQPFMTLLSVTVVMGSLLSGTGAAEGCLYKQYDFGLPGFTEPLSGSNALTQTNFLESREMTTASAAVIASLLGLSLLFRQSKGEQKADKEKPPAASQDKEKKEKPPEASTDKPAKEKPSEASQEKEKKHPEAPGGQLDIKQENQEKVAKKEEKPSAPAKEKEEKKEVAAAQ